MINDREMLLPCGAEWPTSSLVWNRWCGHGTPIEVCAVSGAAIVQQTRMLSAHELDLLVHAAPPLSFDIAEVWAFAERLHAILEEFEPLLRESLQLETGFIGRDCDELLQGTLQYVRGFKQVWEKSASLATESLRYHHGLQERRIRLVCVPWGTVAVILPQNAFLLVAVTALLNGLVTGNRVILRAPQQSARSAALLAAAIYRAEAPQRAASVVLAKARPFIEALCRSHEGVLIHYMGGSSHAPHILSDAFEAGKQVCIDGSGNCWVWIGADMPVDAAVDILTHGALRYNGQTCTSINGALIDPLIYLDVRETLAERWRSLRVGDPATEVDVGPLFDQSQAEWCVRQTHNSGGRIVCGGSHRSNMFEPTLVDQPDPASSLVREGLFGGGLWLAPGGRDDFVSLWRTNRYPLCAGVLSPSADAAWWSMRLPNTARLVLNGDPSVEYTFEPWGGYPSSGLNPVGVWHEKYQRIVSIDEPCA